VTLVLGVMLAASVEATAVEDALVSEPDDELSAVAPVVNVLGFNKGRATDGPAVVKAAGVEDSDKASGVDGV
jgi:hypothetical protein